VTLSDMDLAVALRSLAETAASPLTVATELNGSPPPALAHTVYQLVAQVVQATGSNRGDSTGSVAATVTQSDQCVYVRLTTGHQGSLLDVVGALADRIEALSGALTCTTQGDVQIIEMVLSCGS
jgi:hypothetical protein